MNLLEIFRNPKKTIYEGGNLALDTGDQAQQIDLKVHNRAYIVPILSTLLDNINSGFQQSAGGPLWNPKVLKARKYLSGSSLHFFNTDIPDDEFERVKPKVGDIDTQVNKAVEPQLAQWLNSVKGQVVGNAKFLGYSRGNEQYSSLWELTDPPIKVQIDFEFVDYSEKDQPTDWAAFSHSSSWDDISQGIKGVFHKWLIQSLTKIASEDFILRKVHKRTGKITDKVENDSMISFAVSSKEGGGLRAKYEPVLDEKGRPLEIDGLPVLRELPASDYEKDISKIFQTIFDKRINRAALAKILPNTWSFTGLLNLVNTILPQEEKENVLDSFVNKLFAPGAQGLYKGDPQRDLVEKNAALNYALQVLGITPPTNLEQMRQTYVKNYRVTTEGPVGLDRPIEEAEGDAPVKAQLRKGMPHLHDLKPIDFLDLLDEIHDGNGRFKLENIPLNVKVDGFGGRFGKDAKGRPFMGTSRTEPRYQAGFVKYHQEKGTTDPEILGRAQLFDQLFNEMMNAVKLVDSKLGPDFLINKQVTCEVLYLPFATETPEGKLKFVGIQYDKLPAGVQLALVPFRVVDADTGNDLSNSNEFIKELLSVGRAGSVMFIDNSLTQKEGLDVTALVPPLENLEQFKSMLADKSAGSLQRKRDVAAALEPVKAALEQAIIKDPNIIGKDLLGKDYEGIVINSRLGPIKVTSQEQRDVIQAKQDAKKAAWQEQPREGASKTAVVAIGSFVGHKGHEELFNYTINKAAEVGGNPYLFMGNAVGKDDPIPVDVKLQTWHKMYPTYAKNISGTQQGGSLMQKIKHELINPLPGKPPRYDNIIIMVGEDQASMPIAGALMKAVNKFQGYEHVKVSLEVTPRGTGMSFTKLRNILKDPKATPEQQYALWAQGFDEAKLGKDWILHLMDITRKGMGVTQQPVQQPKPVVAERLSNALIRPRKNIAELSNEKLSQYKKAAGAQASAADKAGDTKKADKRFSGIVKATKKQFANDEKGVNEFAMSGGDDEEDLFDNYPCYDCGSTIFLHHTELCELAEDNAIRDLPSKPGSQHWTGEIPKGLTPIPGLAEGVAVEPDPKGYQKDLLTTPKNSLVIDTPGDLDWYKLGQHYPTLGTDDPHEYGQGDSDMMIVPYSKQELVDLKHKLDRLKMRYKDIGGGHEQPEIHDNVEEGLGAKLAGLGLAGAMALGAGGANARVVPGQDDPSINRLTGKPNVTQVAPSDVKPAVSAPTGFSKEWLQKAADPNRTGRYMISVEKAQELLGKMNAVDEAKKKGADGKACWDGYRYNGTKNGKDSCVKVSEDVEDIIDALINKIIVNEAIQNNRK